MEFEYQYQGFSICLKSSNYQYQKHKYTHKHTLDKKKVIDVLKRTFIIKIDDCKLTWMV